jgi:hypothetical protein
MNFMSRPNPNLLNPNLMVLRDAEASVLSDRVFVQTAELAQPKFKSGVACSLHFSRSVPNWNKKFPSLVQYRHARNLYRSLRCGRVLQSVGGTLA